MSTPKPKIFVVWVGRKPGIYTTWEQCNEQIFGFPKAKYKGFKTRELAEKAFKGGSSEYWGKDVFETRLTAEQRTLIGDPISQSIAVDGAWNTRTGDVEYQGVWTSTKETVFHVGPLPDGTNNIVEFLAIVHALAHCKKNNLEVPVYSDSKVAISWVRDKAYSTGAERTAKNSKLFDMMDRAVKWLQENEYPNKILKWETEAWGENPADFGRK